MEKIAVVGLGIIGGSIAGALTKAGYHVDGFNRSPQALDYALNAGYLHAKGENLADYDVVFLALPPKITMEYLDKETFKENAIVADICGVKRCVEACVYSKKRRYHYVGLHPMAGKETSGIESASTDLFNGANMIITISPQTDKNALEKMKEYIQAMRFSKIVECTADEHDKKIALTSQLAHIVSNAYVKSPQVKGYEGFTGGSFQDMTRIAGVDEKIWTPLYMLNKENITNELNGLISALREYKDALESGDEEKLSKALKDGRLIRETIKRKGE